MDTLVKWVSPTMYRNKEVMLAVVAKNLIKKKGPIIIQSSGSGYKLVFAQVKAGLVGDRLVAETGLCCWTWLSSWGGSRSGWGRRICLFIVDCEQKENVKRL